MKNILITGAFKIGDEQKKQIENLGFNVFYLPDERAAVPFDSGIMDAVICNGLFLYTPIEHFTRLRYIQLTSAGMDRLPVDYIREKDILVHNAKGVYSIPMAEFCIGGILQLYKNFNFFSENKTDKRWLKNRNLFELYGKNACIIGAGSIGNEIAKRLKSFGVKVVGIDLFPGDNCNFECIKPVGQMYEILGKSDIVILTLPLSDETLHFFGQSEFEGMKDHSVFVNISRGKLVDQNAMIDALESGRLYGAVLDVFEEEPLETSSPLWNMKNVVLTPHNSFVGENNNKRLFDLIIKNLTNWSGD